MNWLSIVLPLLALPPRVVYLPDSNQVTCAANELLLLRVTSNVTTGYQWTLSPGDSMAAVVLSGEQGDYVDSGANVPGTGGYQEFKVYCNRAAKPGDSYQFLMVYSRSWAPSDSDEKKTVAVKIVTR